ncbi:glycosyltransferase family 2 protein [Lacrimispora saccharolytica]|uniref:glycosyltransferase family 2 protein n=1 Tax=Lacrimispora saccharolytica TaxID=84030 RepID=UPI00265CF392|nr:glycosyltransferase family 2 protein [Lacrimispora saccharolytica]MCF2656544.1 glycosyltransferase family 2 protein [Lacrimispora saccharolytica]
MLTSVVIPNYNGIRYLKNCLLSLQKCEGEDFEVIVVDNGSTDGSDLLPDSLKLNVRLIKLNENTGFAHAVNVGIREAKGEYVILLNNDTEVESGFVRKLTEALKKNRKAFSASAMMVDMNNREVLDGAGDYYCALGWAFAYGKGKKTEECDKGRKIFSSCAGACIYDKAKLEITGLFDELHFAYLEDVDLGYRARIAGFDNIYEPAAVVYHAGSGFSGSKYNEFKIKLSSRNSVYLILKNMPLLQLIINLPFIVFGYLIKTLFFVLKGYGKVYLKGLLDGFKLYFSKEGHKNKVRFKLSNLKNYFIIEIELLVNIFRRL